MAMTKLCQSTKVFEFRKPSKTSNNPYKVLIFISIISLALIFFIPIFSLPLLPNLPNQSQTSLNSNITRTLKSASSSNISTPHPPSHLQATRKLQVPKLETFDSRVEKFLNTSECEALFFMIWISPAPLFGKREILSLETLFKSHKDGCLIILSKTLDSPSGKQILNPISRLGFRILPVSPDIPLLFSYTPALRWYKRAKTGQIDIGQVPFAQNLSNLMRLVFLYKYGGIYLDTDFIVLRNFSGLKNSIGAQSLDSETGDWSRLNNAVLIFDRSHPLVFRFIKEFVARFNGNKWGHNGPYLVSRVIEKVISSKAKKKKMEGESGVYNFTVLPPEAFYPLDWNKINGLFERPKLNGPKRSWPN